MPLTGRPSRQVTLPANLTEVFHTFPLSEGKYQSIAEEGTARLPQSLESFPLNYSLQVAEAFSQSDLIPLGSTPRHPSNQSSFRKGQTSCRDHLSTVAIASSLITPRPSAETNKPVRRSISPVVVHMALFSSSSNEFRMLEFLILFGRQGS
jgi:hypothetical protein